jgi:Na+-transporting NADH:ubiquinone oxidoreductase subunit A
MRVDLKRGLNVNLGNAPNQTISEHVDSERTALVLDDYHDLHPILSVTAGDRVALGQRLFVDRRHPQVAFTSFTSGVVLDIQRGAKRRIRHLIVERDGENAVAFPQHSIATAARLPRAAVHDILLSSGAWVAIRARPFNRVASPEIEPRAIFVTAIDTNPLAPHPAVVLADRIKEFGVGLTALASLTAGQIYVCVAPGTSLKMPCSEQIQLIEFGGPHPAGLAGTHMHAVGLPINQQPDLWHVGYQDVAAIGSLLLTGRVSPERVISIAGPAAKTPRLIRSCLGTETAAYSNEACTPCHRVLSGSPLSATRHAQYLGRYDNQLTLIPESANQEAKARTWITRIRELLRGAHGDPTFDTAINGWTSGMLPVEAFERVWPFSSPPAPLLRALLAGDTDGAARLGCLGLAEEDLALCEFMCPAKQNYTAALRETLRTIEKFG